ncbi:MAG: Na/Pi cotransporter family protein [Alphaproteobacteria bacterium]|nr:Na/Pi cotransporter family protein [Alphaproteobacteria bacterium]
MLWSTRIVGQGFTRAFGQNLRRIIAKGTGNRFSAFASGAFVTALLQSSTATTLLTVTFAKKNIIALGAAIAVVIGADVSTTLVAQVVSLDISWVSPLLLIIGIVIYLTNERKGLRRHVGRIFIGLGLMLLSLALIREASAPLKHSDLLPLILEPLSADPLFAILVAAMLTLIIHSSLASVLLFSSLAAGGLIHLPLGVLLVLGANLGGALIALSTTFKDGAKAHQITLANLVMRFTIIIATLLAFPHIISYMQTLPFDTARLIIHAHTAFNVVLAIVFLPLITPMAGLFDRLLQDDPTKFDKNAPLFLERHALQTPPLALAGAARETLRIAELVEEMLQKTIKAFETDDKDLIEDIRESDNQIDQLYDAIKLYMTRLSQESLDMKEADRYIQILTFSTNLEHIGDIIDKSLMDLAEKKRRRQEAFSKQGFEEIKSFHERVVKNMHLAQALFMSGDQSIAEQLVEEKTSIRRAADDTSLQHFKRLQEGLSESLATSSLHLDIIRDYRRINSYITRVAYATLRPEEKNAEKLDILQ